MEQSPGDLYDRYVRAVKFFNACVERKCVSQDIRDLLQIELFSQEEFTVWWARVCADKQLKSRWLARFGDPAGYFARTCQRITEELDRIPIQRVAA